MNRNITRLISLAILLLSGCTDEPETRAYVLAEFEIETDQSVIFQAENRVYVTTSYGSSIYNKVTDVYQVDLLTGMKTHIFSTEGIPEKFIVSADEKFLAISVYTQSPTAGATARLELFNLNSRTKSVLKTIEAPIIPCAFDMENKTLLYNIYENNFGNKIRKIDLASGTDVLVSDNPSGIVVAINPITWNILMSSSGEAYFIDWDGNIVGEPITGFSPRFISHDGEKIIGYKGKTVIVDGEWKFYQDVILYTIANGEVVVLTSGDDRFYASSMSTDQNFVLCQAAPDLYVVNTTNLEKNKLRTGRWEEEGIGFFDEGRQVLFEATDVDGTILYGIRLD